MRSVLTVPDGGLERLLRLQNELQLALREQPLFSEETARVVYATEIIDALFDRGVVCRDDLALELDRDGMFYADAYRDAYREVCNYLFP